MVEIFTELFILVWIGVAVVHVLRWRIVVVRSVWILGRLIGVLGVLVIDERSVHADKSCINKNYGKKGNGLQIERKRVMEGEERWMLIEW